MENIVEEGKLTVFLKGRINSDNAAHVQNDIEELLVENHEMDLILDLNELEYISSAGLRVLLYLKKKSGRNIFIINASPEVYDIFNVTGFSELFNIKKKLREISVEGCKVIGQGAVGTVYRLDEDTVVKVYESMTSVEEIEREQKMAKHALLMGIPTAISYDIVRVDGKLGTVFEMLKADNFNDMIIEKPEDKENIVRQYAEFLRQIHSVELDGESLPDMRDLFVSFIDDLGETLPSDLADRLRELIIKMPKCRSTIHGDVQMKNVMLDGSEPLLIDMESLSVGNPVFELQALYIAYKAYPEDEKGNTDRFLGITEEMADYIYNKSMENYFQGYTEEQLEGAKLKIRIVAYIRFLHLVSVRGIGLPELMETRVKHTIEHLREDLPKVDNLEV
ncbi:MAG: anti-sigma factor antagonist [Eubacterium sp.]|nr:anti-sigma factor antagonist [Eubacterium sp.]